MISLFMTFSDPAGERRIHPDEVDAVAELVGSIPDMTEGLLFTPLEQSVDHPYKADGSGPVFALQLRFPDLFACEAGKRESQWEEHLAPAKVIAYDRASTVWDHAYWFAWSGPAQMKRLAW